MGLAGPGGRNTGYKYTKPKKVSSKARSAAARKAAARRRAQAARRAKAKKLMGAKYGKEHQNRPGSKSHKHKPKVGPYPGKAGPRPDPKRTGRTTTNSRYSAPKPATSTKKATTGFKNIPKPKPQKARSAGYFDVLGHYRVQETINSDRFSAPGTIDMNPVPPISETPTDGEYGDFFDETYPADSLEIDIGLTNQDFNNLWVWTEKYDVNGNVYFDGQADIQVAGDYARLEIRIVEGP